MSTIKYLITGGLAIGPDPASSPVILRRRRLYVQQKIRHGHPRRIALQYLPSPVTPIAPHRRYFRYAAAIVRARRPNLSPMTPSNVTIARRRRNIVHRPFLKQTHRVTLATTVVIPPATAVSIFRRKRINRGLVPVSIRQRKTTIVLNTSAVTVSFRRRAAYIHRVTNHRHRVVSLQTLNITYPATAVSIARHRRTQAGAKVFLRKRHAPVFLSKPILVSRRRRLWSGPRRVERLRVRRMVPIPTAPPIISPNRKRSIRVSVIVRKRRATIALNISRPLVGRRRRKTITVRYQPIRHRSVVNVQAARPLIVSHRRRQTITVRIVHQPRRTVLTPLAKQLIVQARRRQVIQVRPFQKARRSFILAHVFNTALVQRRRRVVHLHPAQLVKHRAVLTSVVNTPVIQRAHRRRVHGVPALVRRVHPITMPQPVQITNTTLIQRRRTVR